jgi:hypothetical protein
MNNLKESRYRNYSQSILFLEEIILSVKIQLRLGIIL